MSMSLKTIICVALFDIWELNLWSQGSLYPTIAIDIWSFYFCIYKMELKVQVFWIQSQIMNLIFYLENYVYI